ncbi:MAG: hypothetical protein MZV64_57475 [Ignavibacteriales bacterium]|nr:hypothetical protein [Ignavibacteriales bacterium]
MLTPADWRPGDDVIIPTAVPAVQQKPHGRKRKRYEVLRLVFLYKTNCKRRNNEKSIEEKIIQLKLIL